MTVPLQAPLLGLGTSDLRNSVMLPSFAHCHAHYVVSAKDGLPMRDVSCRSCCRPGKRAGARSAGLEQQVLWQDQCLDRTQWWDNRARNESSLYPDSRHKRYKEDLWPNNCDKPEWVDSQLVRWDFGRRRAAPPTASLCTESTSANTHPSSQGKVREDAACQALTQICDEGDLIQAVDALDALVNRGCNISVSLFYRVLKRCTVQKNLVLGRRVHALAVTSGYETNAFLANHVIAMYASHERLEDALQVLSKVTSPNAYMWSSIILAYARHGQPAEGIRLYKQMRESSVKPDNHVFVAVLKACAAAGDLVSGKDVHADVLASAVKANTFVGNSLVYMYAKCGSVGEARNVFDSLPTKTIVTWTTMIAAYAEQGLGGEALALYETMEKEGMFPADNVTFVCLLKACASMRVLHQGEQLHAQIRKRGLEADGSVGCSLVNMYAKCGSLEHARRVFDRLPRRDVVTWTAMLSGYAQQGHFQEALALHSRMQLEGVRPDSPVTFVCLIQACASMRLLVEGKEIHAQIRERGLEVNVQVGNCLVDMYAKCGSLEEARRVFDRLPTKDVVTWTSMIAGYAQQGFAQEALSVYAQMQQQGVTSVNHVTIVCLLQSCSTIGALQQGKQLHVEARERGLENDVCVGNSLVHMYAKCGSMDEARQVFNKMPVRDVVTWSGLLNGFAEHGDGQTAIKCFEEMHQQGVKPDETTFTCLLVACSHAGLVDEGQQVFKLMVEDYGMVPTDNHYGCMVDLLARSGRLDEAEDLLQTLPLPEHVVGWTSLLSACKNHNDAERGKRCFERLISLDPANASYYVLLGSIYANASRWKDVDDTERLRKSAGAWKKPAKAYIEVQRKVHEFTVGEERSDLSFKLKSVNTRLKEEGGHVPQTELVLKLMSEQEKQDALCGHAEKLALAYGLLNTPDGSSLLVTKNLRMCDDCHSSTKIMSRLEQREIIVRDAHRVHRFLDGSCSCRDRH